MRNSSTVSKLQGEDGQLLQVFQARAVVGVLLLQVILVAGFQDQLDHLRGGCCADFGLSNWAMVAVNCAQATAAFLGTAAQACSALRSGGVRGWRRGRVRSGAGVERRRGRRSRV